MWSFVFHRGWWRGQTARVRTINCYPRGDDTSREFANLVGGNFHSRSCILFALLFLRKTRDHTRRLPLFAVNKSINDGEYHDSCILLQPKRRLEILARERDSTCYNSIYSFCWLCRRLKTATCNLTSTIFMQSSFHMPKWRFSLIQAIFLSFRCETAWL